MRPFVYKTVTRKVKTVWGEFIALHRIKRCRYHKKIFRSDALDSIVSPYCTYSNEVMINAAMKRFIDGVSCSEISRDMGVGISESHVRNLSNMAVNIFSMTHEENAEKLRESMHSWIL
ncbi:MAG: hypothetical protein M1290_05545 [Candidatus Thermoplasmatota archaeon]|jgi:hypothetical protein|nr:hypothetical protein [Candidatus Thermoplasmatota archaeon]MCL5789909.1 hypothetical protein [Candidatus Thermoplasmatota archaeon]